MNKRTLVAISCMLVGAILVVAGLARLPGLPIVLILMGGALGFVGHRIYKLRNNKPDDMNFG